MFLGSGNQQAIKGIVVEAWQGGGAQGDSHFQGHDLKRMASQGALDPRSWIEGQF